MMHVIRMCIRFGCTGPLCSFHYFSGSGEDQVMYDLFGFDIIYEPGDNASGPDYPADD